MLEIFREPFMLAVMAGAMITGVTCAYLGVFMILKRIIFMGIALSQTAALGVAIGLFIGVEPVLSAFVLTLIAIVVFWMPFSERNISREALLGFVYAFSAALSIILIAKNPQAQAHGLNLISGNLLYTSVSEIRLLFIAALSVALAHAVFFKEFLFVSFDRDTALAGGVNANLFDFLLYLSIGVMISLSMRVAGVIFVFSSLVIPAMTAIMLMGTIGKIFLVAPLLAACGVMMGLGFSYVWDLPSGPAVTGMYGVLFFILVGSKFAVKKLAEMRSA